MDEAVKNVINAKTAITAFEIAKTELERVIDENEQLRSENAQLTLELERHKGMLQKREDLLHTALDVSTRWLLRAAILFAIFAMAVAAGIIDFPM